MGKRLRVRTDLIAVILILAMVLSACGSANGNNGPTSTSEGESSKPYEVVMAYPAFGDVTDVGLVQEAISKISLDKINATVKLVPINGSNYSTQMNLMLAGSDKLDLVYSSVWFGFDSQVSRGQLLPMDELLAEYGAGVTEQVTGIVADAGKIKGETYGVPSIKAWALTPSLMMRKDLVEKYQIDSSKLISWEAVGEALQVIKDNEPGVAPMVGYNTSESPGYGMLYFDPLGTATGTLLFEGTDFNLINIYESQEYANMAKLMHEWYSLGYFNKDIATTQETGASLLKAGKAFSTMRNINDCYTESISAGTELVCIPMVNSYMTRNSISTNMMSLARNSENPEKAIAFMNLLYSDKEIINLFTNGIEGKHYVKGADGLISKPNGATSTGYDSNQFAVGNNFLSSVWEGNDPEIWTKMKQLNEEAVKSRAMGFSFDIEPVKALITAVTNVSNQYTVGFQTGTADPALLDEFIKKVKAAGADKIMAEKQKQLDEWLKDNGK